MATTTLSLHGLLPSPAAKKLTSSFLGAPSSLLGAPSSFLRPAALAATATPARRVFAVRAMGPKPGGKPKKVVGIIKLALEAGQATPAPPVGPALGAKGVNIMAFCKDYNAKTADKPGYIIPVEITVFDDKSFTFILKTPPASVLLLKAADHVSFVKEIAAADPPEHLNSLLNVLQARGEKIVSPGAKRGLIPLVVPLSESPQGNLTSLLRWPTAPRGMEMPVVEVRDHGLWLLAKNVNQYIHRILVEADISAESGDDLWSAVQDDLWSAVGEAGGNIYKRGDFKESQMADLDVYLLKKVGLFPDIIESKASRHLEKGDHVSALITGEFYTRDQFPGFGRPFVFNSELQKRVGRTSEAKESARVALKSPWWTLGCKYEEAAELAGWEDEQIEFIREKVTEEGKQDDLKKGKAPEQVVLDEAAFLMDLATVDGNWDDVVDRIAECYREAGIHDIAKFIAYRE